MRSGATQISSDTSSRGLVCRAGVNMRGISMGGSNGPASSSLPTRENSNGVYLSGFRIVQDAMLTRHAEYRVVLTSYRYERWHRFSELKGLCHLQMSEETRNAWEAVRSCKAGPGRSTLDPQHLSRKCLAIERFLRLLLEDLPAHTVRYVLTPRSARHHQHHSSQQRNRNGNRKPGAYLAPTLQRPARTAGSKLRMR